MKSAAIARVTDLTKKKSAVVQPQIKPRSVLAIASNKGGQAKTTTSYTLGCIFSGLGYRVLLVDTDSQGSLTTLCSSVEKELYTTTITDAMLGKTDLPIRQVEGQENLWFVPCNRMIATQEGELRSSHIWGALLWNSIKPVLDNFDLTIIDAPPSEGFGMTNALYAADSVIIPVKCAMLDFVGLTDMPRICQLIGKTSDRGLKVLGILPTFYDSRNNLDIQLLKMIEEQYGGEFNIFSPIKNSVSVVKASVNMLPVTVADPKSPVAKSYLDLAKEVLNNVSH